MNIAAYYDRLAAEHGATPAAVDASSQEALDARYRALGDVCDMNGKRVLDVGCGYGGLGAYLTGRYPEIDYLGMDISMGQLMAATKAHPELRLMSLNVLDFPTDIRCDVVLAQGIFYKLGPGAWEQTKRLIAKMYALADEVCAFTALVELQQGLQSAERDDPDLDQQDPCLGAGHEYRLDPVRALRYCGSIASGVGIRNDYRRGDALFTLYRKAR